MDALARFYAWAWNQSAEDFERYDRAKRRLAECEEALRAAHVHETAACDGFLLVGIEFYDDWGCSVPEDRTCGYGGKA